ncbi:MAG: hypothetical protein M2R46_03285 [Verrucomicrobia subdivision 3 bacterium]|nr:hypothetical protein [Limisphaerales bacterium]
MIFSFRTLVSSEARPSKFLLPSGLFFDFSFGLRKGRLNQDFYPCKREKLVGGNLLRARRMGPLMPLICCV